MDVTGTGLTLSIEQAIEVLNTSYYKHTWDHND